MTKQNNIKYHVRSTLSFIESAKCIFFALIEILIFVGLFSLIDLHLFMEVLVCNFAILIVIHLHMDELKCIHAFALKIPFTPFIIKIP